MRYTVCPVHELDFDGQNFTARQLYVGLWDAESDSNPRVTFVGSSDDLLIQARHLADQLNADA